MSESERRYDKNGRDITARIAAMKAKNPRPASGIPARGLPAKGASIHGGANGFPPRGGQAEASKARAECQRDERGRLMPLPKTIENQQRAERALAKAVQIMEDPLTDKHTQLAAANSIQNRVWGSPPQTNINANVDDLAAMTDEQIRHRLEQVRSRAGIAASDGIGDPQGTA